MTNKLIVFDPWPRPGGQLFDEARWRRLGAIGEIVECDSRANPEAFAKLVPRAWAILGQPDLPQEVLKRAEALRAVINVEGNFFSNIDYQVCSAHGVAVLSIAPAFAVPVAEMAVGLALDLARGISLADAAVRAGTETYGSKGGRDAMMLSRASVGIIGYGAIGRALRKVLRGFSVKASVYDPWLPAGAIADDDCDAVGLMTLLGSCDFIFVCAGETSENRHMLGDRELRTIRAGAALILVSRAGLVDFNALAALVDAGAFRAAVDVFPNEPLDAQDAIRRSRLLLSPHRAGGVAYAMSTAADMILDDLHLMARGLPPIRLQPARAQTVGMMRSKAASYR